MSKLFGGTVGILLFRLALIIIQKKSTQEWTLVTIKGLTPNVKMSPKRVDLIVVKLLFFKFRSYEVETFCRLYN